MAILKPIDKEKRVDTGSLLNRIGYLIDMFELTKKDIKALKHLHRKLSDPNSDASIEDKKQYMEESCRLLMRAGTVLHKASIRSTYGHVLLRKIGDQRVR